MKRALLLFLICVTQLVHAQVFDQKDIPKNEEEYKFQKINLDAKLGVAIPIGNFADANFFSDETRAAVTGVAFGVELNAKPVDIVGFGVDVRGVVNGYNSDPYDYIAGVDSSFIGITTGDYFNMKMMGVFSIGIASKDVEADVKLMAGPMFSRFPEQTLSFSYLSTNYNETRRSSTTIALCYGLGFTSRFYIDDIYIKTFADYLRAETYHEVSYSATGSGTFGQENILTDMQWVTIGVGVGIRF